MLRNQRPENNERKKMRTPRSARTAAMARLHSSKPRNEGQDYLELWSLKLNRARWSRAREEAREKIEAIDHAISKLNLPEAVVPSHEPDEPHVNKTIDFSFRNSAGR